MHEDPLPQCKIFQEEFREHVRESIPVRSTVELNHHQIDTLKSGVLSSMEDIKDIKKTLNHLERIIYGGVISGLIVLLGEAIYFGGVLKQAEIDTKRIDRIESSIYKDGVIMKTISDDM